MPFLAYDKLLASLTGVAVGATMIAFRRHFSVRPATAVALVILLLGYAAAPFATKGGSFIEPRFPLMMGLLLFAGFKLEATARQARAIAVAGLVLFAARAGSVALAWYGHRQDLAELRQAISLVQPGERVLVASSDSYLNPQPERLAGFGRFIPDLSRTDRHIAALLLIERHAFWPLLFADPTQQPLAVRPPYDRIAFPLGEPADYRLLAKPVLAADDFVGAPYLRDWWTTFDYVLIINAAPANDLQDAPAGQVAARLRVGGGVLVQSPALRQATVSHPPPPREKRPPPPHTYLPQSNARAIAMDYVNLGSTGLKVSRLCLGMMTYGSEEMARMGARGRRGAPVHQARARRRHQLLRHGRRLFATGSARRSPAAR